MGMRSRNIGEEGTHGTETTCNRRRLLTGVGALSVSGVAGCVSTNGEEETIEGSGDIGGETLNVMINAGRFAEMFERSVIPNAEEKYDLTINADIAFTGEQTSEITANPDNPPDAVMLGRDGIYELAQQDLLEPLDEHTDTVTHYEDVHDHLKWDDDHGVAWSLGEASPLVVRGDEHWDHTPDTWDEVFRESETISLVPFDWAEGPQVLMMAAAIATDDDFSSADLDIDAGFEYLEEHVEPKVTNIWQNEQQLLQLVGNEATDSFVPWIDYIDPELLREENYEMVRRPDPTGIPYAQCVAVTSNSDNKEAALAYINEALDPDLQEEASEYMGQGVTNANAEMAEVAEDIGAPSAEEFEELEYQDFEMMWENRSEWAERWSALFGG
ncbi:extracellular solute-binding protein [Natrarchaeobius oligotrophus]|nr:extracellular solute-binding protein [Natrarchaeobius chitinivorans]